MVALAVSELGQVRPLCLARPLLFQAQESLESGNLIEAGCQLRESLRRLLYAECCYHRCVPKGRGKNCGPNGQSFSSRDSGDKLPCKVLAKALKRKLGAENCCYQWICEIIDVGNRAAHCKPVDAATLRGSISIMHMLLDHAEIEEPNTFREGGSQ